MDSAPPQTDPNAAPPTANQLPPEAIALASKFFEAARKGQMDVLEQGLSRGLPANLTNDKGDTLVSTSGSECMDLSSDLSPSGNTVSCGSRPYISKSPERKRSFCLIGQLPVLCNETNHHKIMLASYHGHAALVSLLLKQGADPNRLNDRGQSPLAGVVFKNEAECINVLLEGGADPEIGTPSSLDSTKVRLILLCPAPVVILSRTVFTKSLLLSRE